MTMPLALIFAAAAGAAAPVPAAPAAAPPVTWTPSIDVIGAYAVRSVDDGAWFHTFELPRAHLGVGVERGIVRGRVLAEAVRSAAEGALLGVDGDSLVFRVREAWGGVAVHPRVNVRGGVVPTASVPAFETAGDLRALGPGGAEDAHLLAAADLGAQVQVDGGPWGTLSLGAYNGEGYTQRELNRGKSSEVVIEVRPLATLPVLAPLAVIVGGVEGSTGVGRARADRLLGGLVWRGERVRGGADLVYAWGRDGDGGITSWVAEVFVRADLGAPFVGARAWRFQRDVDRDDDHATRIDLTGGYTIEPGVEVYVIGTRLAAGDDAAAAGAAVDAWEGRIALRVRL